MERTWEVLKVLRTKWQFHENCCQRVWRRSLGHSLGYWELQNIHWFYACFRFFSATFLRGILNGTVLINPLYILYIFSLELWTLEDSSPELESSVRYVTFFGSVCPGNQMKLVWYTLIRLACAKLKEPALPHRCFQLTWLTGPQV